MGTNSNISQQFRPQFSWQLFFLWCLPWPWVWGCGACWWPCHALSRVTCHVSMVQTGTWPLLGPRSGVEAAADTRTLKLGATRDRRPVATCRLSHKHGALDLSTCSSGESFLGHLSITLSVVSSRTLRQHPNRHWINRDTIQTILSNQISTPFRLYRIFYPLQPTLEHDSKLVLCTSVIFYSALSQSNCGLSSVCCDGNIEIWYSSSNSTFSFNMN